MSAEVVEARFARCARRCPDSGTREGTSSEGGRLLRCVRLWDLGVFVALAFYVGTYATLSLAGSGQWHVSARVWHAQGCWKWVANTNECGGGTWHRTWLGLAFYPAATADEAWWHKTEWYMIDCF